MIGWNAVVDRRRLVLRELFAVYFGQPADAENARMVLEQAIAENFEFATRHFLIGGLEQRAQRDGPAERFVDAVLHLDELGRGPALELRPGDAAFPARDGIGGCKRN